MTAASHWTRLSGGAANGLPNQGVTDLIADPNNPNRFFTAVPNGAGAGIYVLDTTGGNTNWTNVTGNLPAGALSGQRILLSISTAGVHPIWAGVVNNTGFLQGVYRGVEGGGTVAWTAVGPNNGQPPDIYGLFTPPPRTATRKARRTSRSWRTRTRITSCTSVATPSSRPRSAATWRAATQPLTPGRRSVAGNRVGCAGNHPSGGGNQPGDDRPHSDSRNMVFDGNNIIEVDDGGIYLLTNPTAAAAAPTWSSLERQPAPRRSHTRPRSTR